MAVPQATQIKVTYPKLPVSLERDQIIRSIHENQVTVVVGDTGSGKTTQLPKMALEYAQQMGLKGRIGCTQPRRLAAASVSKRVAEEMKVSLGQEVGYQVRFQDNTSKATRLKFMTDGILLAETQGDIELSQYSVLIIDEAHERSLNIDFLLGYLKLLLERRPDLKVLISSATLDAGGFADFFNGAPVIQVEGRTFPVETEYLPKESSGEDMARHVGRAVEWISRTDKTGDILVFLPGEREIRECVDVLEGRSWGGTEILPLFARLGLKDQQRVFNPDGGRRRVVLATNVAETSLTIPGIVYVIDTGVARVSRWNPAKQVQRLQVEKTSQASANQRKGRCGRVSEGVCVRLYDEEDFEGRSEFTDPEIRRSSLAGVILRMKALGLAAIEDFPFLDPPSSKHINEGYKTLREINALDEVHEMTSTGKQLGRIPVEPRLGKMLLESQSRGCLDAMLVIVSGLSIMDPRERPSEKANEADTAHKKWQDVDSDFMSLIHLWLDLHQFKEGRKWKQNQLRKFCRQRFLNFRRVQEWSNLHHELAVLCRNTFRWHTHILEPGAAQAVDYDELHKSLLSGMPRQVGYFDKEKRAYKGAGGLEFAVFPGSGLFGKKKLDWVIAYEMVDTSRLWARRVAKMDPLWLEEVAPQLCRSRYHSAAWDKKQGAVYAKEIVVCSGLTIVDGRRVHFGRIDPEAARGVFIREGLLAGGMKKKPAFLKMIAESKVQVEEMETKLRRRDGIWSEEAVVEYLEQKLPAQMCTAKSFWRWMTKHEKSLQPTLGDFVYGDLPDISLYPDELYHGEECYPLYYKVAPMDADDGVTIGVHIDQLGAFPEWLVGWGVPGQLEERALLLIKSLPKSQRISCNPAAPAAQAFADEWAECMPRRSIYVELAEFLSGRSRIKIEPSMFNVEKLPEELRTKVWVSDDEGNELALGCDVGQIREQLRDMMAERFEEESGAEWDFRGMKQWECGDLPEKVESPRGIGFPALVDDGDGVSVRVFTDKREADRSHLKGCVRLFLFRHMDHAKYISKQMPLSFDSKMYLPLLGGKGVNHSVLLRTVIEGCFIKQVPRSQRDFERLADQGRGDLYLHAETLCKGIDSFIADSRSIESWIDENRTNSILEEIVEDIEDQVKWLLREGFMSDAGWQFTSHYHTFFKAILERIHRLKAHPVNKDLEKMDRVLDLCLPWFEQWKHRKKDVGLIEAGFYLEMLRVTLFAPNIPMRNALSEKKLKELIAELGVHIA